jgi:hypothetical protein
MLELNCLVFGQPKERIFQIEIESTKCVSNLKDLIKEKKKPQLDYIAADELDLWKISVPYLDIEAFQVPPFDKILPPMETLSSLFPDHTKGKNVEILIKVSSITQSLGRLRLTQEEKLFELFHQKYWKKGSGGWNAIIKRGTVAVPYHEEPETAYEYLDLGPGLETFFMNKSSIFIRDEYKKALEYIKTLQKSQPVGGVILIGQPGIGKTTFLYYVLVCRVLAGEPTMFEYEKHGIYSFTDTFQHLDKIDARASPNAWALSDSNSALWKPNQSFTGQGSQFFVLQATSPRPERWHSWKKYRNAKMVTMDLWSWDEMYIGATKFETTPISTFNVEVLKYVFENYTQSARKCYTLAMNKTSTDRLIESTEVQTLQHSITRFLNNPPDASTLEGLFMGDFADLNDNNIMHQSSDILAIRPLDNRIPVFTIPTRYLCDLISEGLVRKDAEHFWSYFNMFFSVKQSRATAGWMWERLVKIYLQNKNQELLLRPLSIGGDKTQLEKLSDDSGILHTPFNTSSHYKDQDSLAEAILRFASSTDHRNSLFIPGAPNQVTFDAFSLSKNGFVTVFQMTVSEQQHSIKASGLEFIRDALLIAKKQQKSIHGTAQGTVQRATQKSAQKKAQKKKVQQGPGTEEIPQVEIEGFFPGKNKKWRLVFCVPRKVKDKWNRSQIIDYQGKNPERSWEEYIEQSVAVFEPELDKSTNYRSITFQGP